MRVRSGRPRLLRSVLFSTVALATVLVAGTSVGSAAQGSAAASTAPASSPAASAGGSSGASLATPEDTVATYLAAVSAGDVDAILETSGADQMATGFDLAAYVERLGAYDIATAPAPAEYPLYARMNQVRLEARLLTQVQMLADGLLSDETIDGNVIVPADRAWAEAFSTAVDPTGLAGITVEAVRFPVPGIEKDPRYQQNSAAMAAVFGADEQTERLALFSLDGAEYQLGFTLLRYGDAWKVASQVSPLAGMSPLGTAEATTRADFDQLTGGD